MEFGIFDHVERKQTCRSRRPTVSAWSWPSSPSRRAASATTSPNTRLLHKLSCPLLGLFGAEDPAPPVDEVAELEAALKEHGKTFEIEVYENAGHAFFSVDSQKYRTTAALAGWQRILTWFTRYLAAL